MYFLQLERRINISDIYRGKNRLGRFSLFLISLTVFLLPCYSDSRAAEENASLISLQDIVDKASPGERIVLPDGSYLGPIRIDKQIVIQASEQVVLVNDHPAPAISIQADGVVVQGIRIIQKQGGDDSTAVSVQADEVILKELEIRTRGYGIQLRDAHDGALEGNYIAWDRSQGPSSLGEKGNGIDLYKSSGNLIEQNVIVNMRDGIYLDNSKDLMIADNQIFESRYGIHCMYVDGTKIVGNVGEYNITGAMIMGVREVTVSSNSFAKQRSNVNSQGILLYDVRDSLVEKNVLEGNRVGIYLERSSQNELSYNSISRNFVGIQFVSAEDNLIHYNDFVANVIEAEATKSESNQLHHNFWDMADLLDLDDDGVSELSYTINPFYRNLITRIPAFQLFFQSPGIHFLSTMAEQERQGWTIDHSPGMKLNMPRMSVDASTDNNSLPESTFLTIVASMLLLISGLTIIYSRGSKE